MEVIFEASFEYNEVGSVCDCRVCDCGNADVGD